MSFILLQEQVAPATPGTNQVLLYPLADGLLYSKDDTGTETAVASGSATQAQQEAGVSTSVYVSPGRQQFHPSAAKAWCKFNGTGTISLDATFNVNNITDNGVGDYTVNFLIVFSSANYCGAGMTGVTAGLYTMRFETAKTAGSSQITTRDGAFGVGDAADVSIAFFGDQ